ncbi:MAG TPA: response regulator [Gammaproteobacteria bacterium]
MPGSTQTTRRVLVVDDDRDGADSLGLLLALDGHKTFVCYDGRTALEMLAAERPEIALLDIGMPDCDGYELCASIRREPWGERMLLFALTGWAREEDRRRATEAGFDGYLVKPVSIENLKALLADPAARSDRLARQSRRDPMAVTQDAESRQAENG